MDHALLMVLISYLCIDFYSFYLIPSLILQLFNQLCPYAVQCRSVTELSPKSVVTNRHVLIKAHPQKILGAGGLIKSVLTRTRGMGWSRSGNFGCTYFCNSLLIKFYTWDHGQLNQDSLGCCKQQVKKTDRFKLTTFLTQ